MKEFIKLVQLRFLLKIGRVIAPPINTIAPPGLPSSDFIENIKKIDQLVSSWGGKLYGMYWPPLARYKDIYNSIDNKSPTFPNPLTPVENYGNLEKILNIGIINMRKEIFDVHSNPSSLYNGDPPHLNEEAQRLMAEAIVKRLKADGLPPENPSRTR